MSFSDLVRNRFSVRSYKRDPIEKEKLGSILEAARIAPTAANRQAFKVVVIKTEGREEELKKVYARDWFVQAPLVLGVFSKPEGNWVRSDSVNYHHVDASIIMDHIILQATELGLGTCWIGAFDAEAARQVVGLGEGYEPVAFTPLGYSDSIAPQKKRKQLDEIVVYQ